MGTATIQDQALVVRSTENETEDTWSPPTYVAHGLISQKIQDLKDERKYDKQMIRELELYDEYDPYEDGTVITWKITDRVTVLEYQAAVREGGQWFVTGTLAALSWEQLVVKHLAAQLGNEITYIFPGKGETH